MSRHHEEKKCVKPQQVKIFSSHPRGKMEISSSAWNLIFVKIDNMGSFTTMIYSGTTPGYISEAENVLNIKKQMKS